MALLLDPAQAPVCAETRSIPVVACGYGPAHPCRWGGCWPYVPAVLAAAAAGALARTVCVWALGGVPDRSRAALAALGVLVMGYPCALGMATPLATFRAGGEAAALFLAGSAEHPSEHPPAPGRGDRGGVAGIRLVEPEAFQALPGRG